MLKRLSQCSLRVAPSSSSLLSTTSFHTSATLQVLSLKRRRNREQNNAQKKPNRKRLAESNRPHVVLGHRPGDTAKWSNCNLAKVLVNERDTAATTLEQLATGAVHVPTFLNYGIGEREKELLFETLPQLSIENVTKARLKGSHPSGLVDRFADADQRELYGLKLFVRAVSLRNANAKGIAYENRKRIVAEFSEPTNPEDPGRPEVQAALLTYRIRNLWDHLQAFRADIGNRRGLTKLVHQRAKILKYLKRKDRDRYDRLLERLALEPEAVEGELVV